ncbi:hypothetical protein ABL78_3763 [Leptomonas seymouri]|uniref:Uncharacterized protein n=1 Tax=Leptomonas seymouri TaxID=5684 RepID=A0A0N1HZ50_LEPSE|nr:hypothetical protein ABL78_3763 [Leptomonas seymouri]|eukprot:KPI87161.1 hypothetical protein ABL78_3763 [Leptomonas seymouri]
MQHSNENRDSESGPSALSSPTSSRSTSTTSKHYASAPFLLQGPLSRRGAAVNDLVIVDTPPSFKTNPDLQTISLSLQSKGNPMKQWSPALAARSPHILDTAPSGAPHITLPLRDLQGGFGGTESLAMSCDECSPLTNASAPSLPYTWHESYLEESPNATRARWLNRQTFGPVLQSEYGGDSTISCSVRETYPDAETVWGGLLARNAQARDGKGESLSAAETVDHKNNIHGGSCGRRRERRFNLATAKIGGEGVGRGPLRRWSHADESVADVHRNPHGGESCALPAAKALFPAPADSEAKSVKAEHSDSPKHLLSDVSTVIATVQQARRLGPAAALEKRSRQMDNHCFPTLAQSNQPHPDGENAYLSTSTTLLPLLTPCDAADLRASREGGLGPPPCEAARGTSARLSACVVSSPSLFSGVSSLTDAGEDSTGNMVKANDGRSSRSGPIRRRVLKPIYDD